MKFMLQSSLSANSLSTPVLSAGEWARSRLLHQKNSTKMNFLNKYQCYFYILSRIGASVHFPHCNQWQNVRLIDSKMP